MSDGDDYLYELGHLSHKPLNDYPRKGMAAETIFAREWERLMLNTDERYFEAPNARLDYMLGPMQRPLDQRMASVAASLVCWLGTNCGNSLLQTAKAWREKLGNYGFVAAWAAENHRRTGISNTMRVTEHLLAPPDCRGKNEWDMGNLIFRPELSLDDYEAMEHVMDWLGNDGYSFIEHCEARLKRYRELKQRRDGLKFQRRQKRYDAAKKEAATGSYSI